MNNFLRRKPEKWEGFGEKVPVDKFTQQGMGVARPGMPTETLDKALIPEEAKEQMQTLKGGVLQDRVNRISWLHERGKRAPFIEDMIDGARRPLLRIEKLERVNKAFPPECPEEMKNRLLFVTYFSEFHSSFCRKRKIGNC